MTLICCKPRIQCKWPALLSSLVVVFRDNLSMLTINIYKQALCTRKIEFIKIKCQAQISFSIMLHNWTGQSNQDQIEHCQPFSKKHIRIALTNCRISKLNPIKNNQKIRKHSNNRRCRRKWKTVHVNVASLIIPICMYMYRNMCIHGNINTNIIYSHT